ncbi:MAG: histidine phosphatase family protein [Bacteroidales bacterium]
MKTLYIVRHGKSSWEDAGIQDFERPLLPTGKKRTLRIADHLLKRPVMPDLIVSSHAVRAFETASLLAGTFNYPRHKIQVESAVYHHGVEGLWSLIFSLPDDKHHVMVVGHNPALTQFVNGLLDRAIDYLPTSAVASFSFFTNHWNEVMLVDKKTNFLIYPSHLEKTSS